MMNVPRRRIGRKSKYGNIKTFVDGRLFASKREAARYSELRILLRAGEIGDLVCQPRLACPVGSIHVCTYVPDFSYWDHKKNSQVFEDVKGYRTAIYRLKKKLVLAVHGIEIKEVR